MKFKSYLIFFLLFGVVPDLYIALAWFPEMPLLWKGLLCLPTLAALISLCLIRMGVRYTPSVTAFSYLIFLFALPKTVFTLFSAIGRYIFGQAPATAGWISLAFALGVSAFFATLIFFTTRHLKVNKVELSFGNLPQAFDGLRICQLTDLHLGSFGTRSRYIKRIIDTTLSLSPDLILFTGDLVNFESSEADYYLEELGRLKAPMGIYAIRGNHDYLLHGPLEGAARQQDTDRLLAMEKGLGWNVLLNGNTLLRKDGEEIALVGVENVSANPYFLKMGGDLKKAVEGLPDGIFVILLSHDPSHWRGEVVPSTDIPLTLSGHTHGLKYKLAGLHPSHWKLPESGGLYTRENQVLHVSRGLGSAFAFRLGGFPMVDIITLRRKIG